MESILGSFIPIGAIIGAIIGFLAGVKTGYNFGKLNERCRWISLIKQGVISKPMESGEIEYEV